MNFIGDCIKVVIAMFLLMAFIGHIMQANTETQPQETDERKEVFMEDCMSVSFNTKQDCEIIFKQLKQE